MENDIQPIDYGARAKSRIIQQYKNLPKLTALIEKLAQLVEDGLEKPCSKLLEILDIDIQEGRNLDVIGEIVGQPRVIATYADLVFFGLIDEDLPDDPSFGSFGDETDAGVGARFYGSEDTTTIDAKKELEDPEYRLFIKARILKNYSTGTLGDFAAGLKILTGAEQVKIDETAVMELTAGVLGTVDANMLAMLDQYDILPRSSGVKVNELYSYSILKSDAESGNVPTLTSAGDFDIDSSDFRIRFRIKTNVPDHTVLFKGYISPSLFISYHIEMAEGKIVFEWMDVAEDYFQIGHPSDIADGEFHLVEIEGVSGTVTIIVDGIASTGTGFTAISSIDDVLSIGKDTIFGGSSFGGILQELSISVAGVEKGRWTMIKPHADIISDPDTLVDISGNGNDITLTNPIWQNNLNL